MNKTQETVMVIIVIYIIMMISYSYAATEIHEKTHQQIFLYHGCSNTTTTNDVFSGETKCNNWDVNATSYDQQQALLLNTQFDMKDYSVQFLTNLCITLAAIIVMVVVLTRK